MSLLFITLTHMTTWAYKVYVLLSYEIISYVLKVQFCWTSRRIKSIRHAPWSQLSSSSLRRRCHRFLDILRRHNRCPKRRHRKFRSGCHLEPPEVRLSHPVVKVRMKPRTNTYVDKVAKAYLTRVDTTCTRRKGILTNVLPICIIAYRLCLDCYISLLQGIWLTSA